MNPDAVNLIFKAKQRPLTDPVIVHVLDFEQAKPLINISEKLMKCYKFLTDVFWPGPLTIVTRANMEIIPENITAKTGFVGIRSPKHIVARELIRVAERPIAAPSANRFGHVSPTKAQHVYDDLNECGIEILILDSTYSCEIGIESTVAKLEELNDDIYLTILRRGGISQQQLFNSLEKYTDKVILNTQFKKVGNDDSIGQEAPGQLITHYAPDIPAYLYKETVEVIEKSSGNLQDAVIVDFKGLIRWAKEICLEYYDLSEKGDISEAANNLFDVLRKCEKVKNAKFVLLPNVSDIEDEHALALFDRVFRAASGKYCNISKSELQLI